MIRSMMTAVVAMTLFAGTAATAAPCRDSKGKFIKCAPAAPTAGTRCKDAKGKFAKCGTPGAAPVKK